MSRENALGHETGVFIAAPGDVVPADDAQADPVQTQSVQPEFNDMQAVAVPMPR